MHSSPTSSASLLSILLVTLASLVCIEAQAEQPIFDEMPRWNDGYGLQILQEFVQKPVFLDGSDAIPGDFDESRQILHQQGVYTWEKAIRLTAKVPFLLKGRRSSPDGDEQERASIGDVKLTLPSKSTSTSTADQAPGQSRRRLPSWR